jgi:hypothetical protein
MWDVETLYSIPTIWGLDELMWLWLSTRTRAAWAFVLLAHWLSRFRFRPAHAERQLEIGFRPITIMFFRMSLGGSSQPGT